MIEQNEYVRRVTNLLGFHEPPPNVREMIEQLHTERVRISAAYEYLRRISVRAALDSRG